MADEGKGVALVILGIVAIVAIIGLVMLFKGGATGAAAPTFGPCFKQYANACASAGGFPAVMEFALFIPADCPGESFNVNVFCPNAGQSFPLPCCTRGPAD